jgi:hypothetical protein
MCKSTLSSASLPVFEEGAWRCRMGQGMKKRKEVKILCCPATVMGTKANKVTVRIRRTGRRRVGSPKPGDLFIPKTSMKGEKNGNKNFINNGNDDLNDRYKFCCPSSHYR